MPQLVRMTVDAPGAVLTVVRLVGIGGRTSERSIRPPCSMQADLAIADEETVTRDPAIGIANSLFVNRFNATLPTGGGCGQQRGEKHDPHHRLTQRASRAAITPG